MNSITKDDDVSAALADGYQLFYFYGSSMPFHKKLCRVLEHMETKYNTLSFFSIDVYLIKTLISRFSLTEVPTFILFYNGLEKKRVSGVLMASALKSFIIANI